MLLRYYGSILVRSNRQAEYKSKQMREELRKIFDAGRPELVKNIDSDSGLLNQLIKYEVLSEEHVETIKSKRTKRERNEKLLDILKQRDDEMFEHFCKCLIDPPQNQSDLVKKYLIPPDETTDNSSSVSSPPIRSNEFARLRLVLSRVEEENRELILENDLLRIQKDKQDLEIKLSDVTAQLDDLQIQNEKNKKIGELQESELRDLEKKYKTLLFEFNATRKQNTRLNDQLEKIAMENKQLEADLASAEKEKEEAVQTIRSQRVELKILEKAKIEIEIKLEDWEEANPKPVDKIIQVGEDIKIDGGSPVMGVTWLQNRIVIVCLKSPKIFIFSDQKPFKQIKSEEFEIKDMTNPRDVTAHLGEGLIFVGDHVSERENKIWKIQVSKKQDSRWAINRKPEKLSINYSDELLVLVSNRLNENEDEYFLYIYKSTDGELLRQIILPNRIIHEALHVVQPTKGIFIISHKSQEFCENGQQRSVWLVSKMTTDGNIISSFRPSLVESIELKRPEHLLIGENNKIIVVDQFNDRVVILGPRLTSGQVMIKHDSQHKIKKPNRICYSLEKRIYIVGQWTSAGSFSVFSRGPPS